VGYPTSIFNIDVGTTKTGGPRELTNRLSEEMHPDFDLATPYQSDVASPSRGRDREVDTIRRAFTDA